ncbi:MAG: EamA family transporter [Planctomycetota bacterium]|jgi:drug/metabolite transporter (DMT)-like permease
MWIAQTSDMHGVIAAGATAFCWAMTALFFSAAARRVGHFYVNQTRIVIGCILLGIGVVVFGSYEAAPNSQIILLALSGVVGLALGDAALFSCLQILGPRRGSLLMALAPGMAALMMIPLLGEGLNAIGIVGMVITLAGVMWVVSERGQPGEIVGGKWLGVIMGALGAAGQAGGLILSKAGLGMKEPVGLLNTWSGQTSVNIIELSPLYGTFLRMVAGTVLLVGWAILSGRFGKTLSSLRDRKALGQSTAGAVFGPALGVTFSLMAVAWTNTAVAATIMATSPVVVIPVVWIAYGQKPSGRAVVGAVIAVAGVGVLTFREALSGLA